MSPPSLTFPRVTCLGAEEPPLLPPQILYAGKIYSQDGSERRQGGGDRRRVWNEATLRRLVTTRHQLEQQRDRIERKCSAERSRSQLRKASVKRPAATRRDPQSTGRNSSSSSSSSSAVKEDTRGTSRAQGNLLVRKYVSWLAMDQETDILRCELCDTVDRNDAGARWNLKDLAVPVLEASLSQHAKTVGHVWALSQKEGRRMSLPAPSTTIFRTLTSSSSSSSSAEVVRRRSLQSSSRLTLPSTHTPAGYANPQRLRPYQTLFSRQDVHQPWRRYSHPHTPQRRPVRPSQSTTGQLPMLPSSAPPRQLRATTGFNIGRREPTGSPLRLTSTQWLSSAAGGRRHSTPSRLV
ncbi:hypothetical protein FOZ60_004127 [Perkinsus olseni]|uniref:Uncharacterized protein n=1 Tax=Perkinsus olseni TaxID=32597 RepID=A0A7J6NTQ6_PEROL|nr:hypothetical protein FOZ60_004127 [Perkinsus olseni]